MQQISKCDNTTEWSYARMQHVPSAFPFFVVVTSPSSKISSPYNSSFLQPSSVPPCFSAIMGKDKIFVRGLEF